MRIFSLNGIVDEERFYVQDAGDGSSESSDGIFIYVGSDPTVSSGDDIAVSGTATESYDQTQITLSELVRL